MTKWQRIIYHPNLPLGENGQRITAWDAHIQLSKNAAKEGMVLLKNKNSLLPLEKGAKLALFGKGTFDYVKGGGGSGDVTVAYICNLYEGLRSLPEHVQLEENLADFYRSYVQEQYAAGRIPGMLPEAELPEAYYQQAREFTDTALITISRFSGEGWDRGVKDDPLYENGDFYLSNREKAMVEKVKSLFPKVVVVLNVGGMVDTQWFCDDDSIGAALMAWQGGMEGGTATAELLCGIGCPSGKLVDTFAKRLEDYPSTESFHESDDYVAYNEDIYVGYRYFETIPGAAEKVNYPFGFGLSYTEFDWSVDSTQEKDGRIQLAVTVKNTGSCPGREVIQVYLQAPQGKLGKAARSLVAYKKTSLLQPGESQVLQLAFDINDCASYDDLGKVQKAAYVLEKGEYKIHVGNSIRNTVCCQYVYPVDSDLVVQQLSSKLVPSQLKKRLLSDGSYEQLLTFSKEKQEHSDFPKLTDDEYEGIRPVIRGVDGFPSWNTPDRQYCFFEEVADGKATLDDFVRQLTDAQLLNLMSGQPNSGVSNTFGFGNIPEYGVPNATTADGPAGIRIKPECGVCTTAFPCVTQVCCSWDPELSYAIGQAGAMELKENNLAAWLTPAVNIHRSPLCGRNFEYYSEDPLLAGTMATSFVKGVQSQKVSACVKHFALNNKETNRKESDSRVSERAAREIYLKPFEIIVKNADPWYIMSSYNVINGCRASENRELLEDVLRDEWGFNGMVSTDWCTHGEQYKEIKAGNDLKMPAGFPDRLKKAFDLGLITRQEMELSAKRILGVILRLA